jgi:hypothetical protein
LGKKASIRTRDFELSFHGYIPKRDIIDQAPIILLGRIVVDGEVHVIVGGVLLATRL